MSDNKKFDKQKIQEALKKDPAVNQMLQKLSSKNSSPSTNKAESKLDYFKTRNSGNNNDIDNRTTSDSLRNSSDYSYDDYDDGDSGNDNSYNKDRDNFNKDKGKHEQKGDPNNRADNKGKKNNSSSSEGTPKNNGSNTPTKPSPSAPTADTMARDAGKKAAEKTGEMAAKDAAKVATKAGAKAGANAVASSAGAGASSALAAAAPYIAIGVGILLVLVLVVAALFATGDEKMEESIYTLDDIIKKEEAKGTTLNPSILFTNADVKRVYQSYMRSLDLVINNDELTDIQIGMMDENGYLNEDEEYIDERVQEIEGDAGTKDKRMDLDKLVPLTWEEGTDVNKFIGQIIASIGNILGKEWWWYREEQPLLQKYLKAERYNHNKVKWYRYYRGDYNDKAGYPDDKQAGSGLLVLDNKLFANEYDPTKNSKDPRDTQLVKGGLKQDKNKWFNEGTYLTYPDDPNVGNVDNSIKYFTQITAPYLQFWGIPYALHIATENYKFGNAYEDFGESKVEVNQYVLQYKNHVDIDSECSGPSNYDIIWHENEYRVVKAVTFDKYYDADYSVKKYTAPSGPPTVSTTTCEKTNGGTGTVTTTITHYQDEFITNKEIDEGRELKWEDLVDELTDSELEIFEKRFQSKPYKSDVYKLNRAIFFSYKSDNYKDYLIDTPYNQGVTEENATMKAEPYTDLNLHFAFEYIDKLIKEREKLYANMPGGGMPGVEIGKDVVVDPCSKYQWPFPAVTQFRDDYPNYSNGGAHGGTDLLPADRGSHPIYAVADGVVTRTVNNNNGRYNPWRGQYYRCNGDSIECDEPVSKSQITYDSWNYGNMVQIAHTDKDGNRTGIVTIYGHMKQNNVVVNVGDKVTSGQFIGNSGNTGISTDPHLHFEVKQNGKRIKPSLLFGEGNRDKYCEESGGPPSDNNEGNGDNNSGNEDQVIKLRPKYTVNDLPRSVESRNFNAMHKYLQEYGSYIIKYCSQYGFPKEYIIAMIAEESGFNTNAANGGAKGLLQLEEKYFSGDLYDPENNIRQGVQTYADAYKACGNVYEALGRGGLGEGNWTKYKNMAGINGNVSNYEEANRVALQAGNGNGQFMSKMEGILKVYKQYYIL